MRNKWGRGQRVQHLGYSLEELSTRPIEHVIEALTVDELSEALGVARSVAGLLKSAPWEYTSWDETAVRKVREWLTCRV